MAKAKAARAKQAHAKTASRRAVKRRERKDTRPQEIVAAAFEEFAAHGYAGTRLEDVATRARVSKGLPYLYFKTKEELFKAVVRSVISAHFDTIREQMEKTELPVEAFLKGPFLAFVQELVCSKRAFIARLLIAEGHKHPELTQFYYEQVVSRGIETLTRLIERGIERGEFKPTKLRDYPQLLIAPMLTAIIWRGLFERYRHLDTDELLKTNIELLTDAIRAPGVAPKSPSGAAR
ncbi:MAG: TetR/AcrR family transcriptional regulator [Actinomycetota bacterium]